MVLVKYGIQGLLGCASLVHQVAYGSPKGAHAGAGRPDLGNRKKSLSGGCPTDVRQMAETTTSHAADGNSERNVTKLVEAFRSCMLCCETWHTKHWLLVSIL